MKTTRFVPWFVLAALLAAPPAHAENSATAEALFREGRALMDRSDYEHACPKLQESYRVDPATGTLLALALCFEGAGKRASAWKAYGQAAVRAHQDGRADRERLARDRLAVLEPQLSKLTLLVPSDVAALPGLSVLCDGEEVQPSAFGTPFPVDGGEHTLQASAAGYTPWQASVSVATEKASETVSVPPLTPLPAVMTPEAPPRNFEPNIATAKANTASAQAPPWRTIGLVTGGVGVVSILVGTAFGLKAKSLDDQSREDGHCNGNVCDSVGHSLRDDAFSRARTATGLFVAGGALVAGGVVLYVVGGSRQQTGLSLQSSLFATRDAASISLKGAF